MPVIEPVKGDRVNAVSKVSGQPHDRGTYTGWNPIGSGVLKGRERSLAGGYIPFAKTKAERLASGDPRLSIEERHPSSRRILPVILTALAAMLAFIPLTHSVFWGTLAYTLIGGTFGGTILTLMFLPALYAIWFKIKPPASSEHTVSSMQPEPVAG